MTAASASVDRLRVLPRGSQRQPYPRAIDHQMQHQRHRDRGVGQAGLVEQNRPEHRKPREEGNVDRAECGKPDRGSLAAEQAAQQKARQSEGEDIDG